MKPTRNETKGRSRPSSAEMRLAAHALRWAAFGYRKPAEQMAVGNVRRWLLDQIGNEPRRHALAEELELYAINTRSFYDSHASMVASKLARRHWRRWVRRQINYSYTNEVGPVWIMPVEVCRAARSLQRYYERRVAEQKAERAAIDAWGKKGGSK